MNKGVVDQISWVPLDGSAGITRTPVPRTVRKESPTATPQAQRFDAFLDDAIRNRPSPQPAGQADRTFAKLWARQVVSSTQQMLFSSMLSSSDKPVEPFGNVQNLLALTMRVSELKRPLTAESAPYRKGSTFDNMVSLAGRRYRLPEKLIHAVIKAESNYNPKAKSPVGAQGLMQLMPDTARKLGVRDAFDPFENIMGGSRYLRSMLDRYNGNLRSALSAYNWGPANVDAKGTADLPDETKAYLKRIGSLLKDKVPW